MDERLKPGSVVWVEAGAIPPVIFRPPSYKIRVTGPDIDMSLSIDDLVDFEIIEKLLAKIRLSVSAGAPQE